MDKRVQYCETIRPLSRYRETERRRDGFKSPYGCLRIRPAAHGYEPPGSTHHGFNTKGNTLPAVLLLADGTVFYGRACGACGTATGEVCFNTSLEGYFEVLTDPSYAGQIVTMTYPQIGNYGIDLADVQSAYPGDADRPASAPALRGMVACTICAARRPIGAAR